MYACSSLSGSLRLSQTLQESSLALLVLLAQPGFTCAPGKVLKLKTDVYCLHQAPSKFKTEVVNWFHENRYQACNAAETIWILSTYDGVLVHTICVNYFLHFSRNNAMYHNFDIVFLKHFGKKFGEASICLGNKIRSGGNCVPINQTTYTDEVLDKFGMKDCNAHGVKTPLIKRLTKADAGPQLPEQEHGTYW